MTKTLKIIKNLSKKVKVHPCFKFKMGGETSSLLEMECISEGCSTMTNISAPWCRKHLLEHDLTIKQTTLCKEDIPFDFLGLFAYCIPGKSYKIYRNKKIVFKKGDNIAPYIGIRKGEHDMTLYQYGDKYFSPYLVRMSNTLDIDCARLRSAASLCNTDVKQKCNAKMCYDRKCEYYPVVKAMKNIYEGDEIIIWLHTEWRNLMLLECFQHETISKCDYQYYDIDYVKDETTEEADVGE